MSGDIGSIGSVQQGVTAQATAVQPTSSLSASGFADYIAPAGNSSLFQNPRLVMDPTAGFITQYLSANGSQVISQTPNAITVAYLRNGLTADGLPKASSQATGHIATTA